MAYIFGDSFDLYAVPADTSTGYWDSGSGNFFTLAAGRFGGRCVQTSFTGVYLIKSSGSNDAVHHIVCAFEQTAALSGSTLAMYLQLSDGATNQCCIVFRSDGAILLTSATPGGTVLATYTGAVTLASQWVAFEFEVVIHPTAGRFRVRKNGSTSDDFDSGAVLNTRPGANSYANKLTMGQNTGIANHLIDDLLWRSDASSVPFVGDIRCYTRMPASDAAVQFSRPASIGQTFFSGVTAQNVNANQGRYLPFTPSQSGSISNITLTQNTATPTTANMKCAIYATSPGTPPLPAALLAQATAPINCSTVGAGGAITFTFSPAFAVTAGTTYAVGVCSDASTGFLAGTTVANSYTFNTPTYAGFPVTNPSGLANVSNAYQIIITLSPINSYMLVNEPQQDSAATYVYSSNVGDTDLYGIAAIGATPASTIAVTTRAFVQKSDAGSRNGKVVLKSGGTTVDSGSAPLSTTWAQMYRTDTLDPATGAAWTAVGVNAVQIGVAVSA